MPVRVCNKCVGAGADLKPENLLLSAVDAVAYVTLRIVDAAVIAATATRANMREVRVYCV